MLHEFEDDSRVTASQDLNIATRSSATPLPTAVPSSARVTRPNSINRRWAHRGAAVALVLGLAACGGGSDDPPASGPAPEAPAPEAPAPEAPAPEAPAPEAPDPTPAGFTKLDEVLAADTTDVGDAFTKGTRTVFYDAKGLHYYELVTPAAPINWTDAKAAAVAAGGDLASPSTAAKLLFLKQAFANDELPVGMGVGGATGSNGAWIGLQQTAGGSLVDGGWSFLDTTPLPAGSAFWNSGEPNDADGAEDDQENYGALFYGMAKDHTDLGMIYDAGLSGATDTQTMYLIEYTTKESIK